MIIVIFQNLFGKALRDNPNDAEAMSRQTKSILGHYSEIADHKYCPDGGSSYCTFKKDIALGTNTHRPPKFPLPPAVTSVIKPIFDDLSDVNFLKSCEGAYTQNSNESLHHVCWSKVNKEQGHGNFANELGICLGTLQFNKGHSAGIGSVMDKLHLPKPIFSRITFRKLDEKRIKNSIRNASCKIKQRRKQLRYAKRAENVAFLRSEGPTYAKGKFTEKSKPFKSSKKSKPVQLKKKRAPPTCKKCGAPRKGHPRDKCSNPEKTS